MVISLSIDGWVEPVRLDQAVAGRERPLLLAHGVDAELDQVARPSGARPRRPRPRRSAPSRELQRRTRIPVEEQQPRAAINNRSHPLPPFRRSDRQPIV
jgi:hypothetical protein